MSKPNFAPTEINRTNIQIGLVVEDQRSGDLRRVLYVDSHVVLLRDEANHTTLLPRDSFESTFGSRYRPSTEGGDAIDDGQYGRLRDRLAEYEATDGRKAAHKVAALREALDIVGGGDGTSPDPGADADGADDTDGDSADEEIAFDEITGIGPETAGKLRANGFVTEADVRSASDDEILAVSGVGPSNLANIREF
jgi:predicted flap endonuclease-1-like 5' DNA nuclease